MTDLRVLYIRKSLSVNGRHSLAGRKLYDAFRDASAECLLGHYVCEEGEDISRVDPRWADDYVSQDILNSLRPNLIYIEGGLLADDSRWKVPREVAERIVGEGAVLIAADVDVNKLRSHKAQYHEAATFFKAHADYGSRDSSSPVYGIDQASSWKGAPVCKPSEMIISDWLKPVYDGVSEVIVGGPVRLSAFEGILATGNRRTSGTLQDDLWVDQIDAFPWASVASVGHGYAALITGGVSSDVWLERCPDNTPWLLKVGQHLVDQAVLELERAATHLRSPYQMFFSHRSVDKAVVDHVAADIKRLGVGIWYDKEQLVPSDSLSSELDRGLRHMSHYVLFWSERCLGAPWVERELQVAVNRLVEHRVPVLIVRLDDTSVPTIVSDLLRIEAQQMAPPDIARAIVDTVRRLAERQTPRS